jgi:opacity protein-like surface antigen
MMGPTYFAYRACIRPNVLAYGVSWNISIQMAGALALMLLSATAAQAQCTSAGKISMSPEVGRWTAAVAGGSASVAALISSINSANTAFLTQSSAFIGSPPNPQPDDQGGGVWVRSVGGHLDSATATTASNVYLNGSLPGNITCNTRTREDFAGIQAGTDVARLNVSGWNLHAGLTTGYLGSDTHDTTQGLNPSPSFRNSLQIPFAGLYGAASYGGFLFDGQVRGDFYQNEVSDQNRGLTDQRFGARGFSMNGNVAYRQNLANQWFIEPSAGIIWSRTHVDPLNAPGTSFVFGTGAVLPWVLTVNDIYSTLGRVSIRTGTTVRYDDAVLQPFASFGVFHELHGGAAASLTSHFWLGGVPETYSSTILTTGLGTYAQFGAGVAAQIVDTGWVAYLRGDYRTGDNIEGWTLNGGIRYQFTPEPVRRQGPGIKEPLITKAPVYKAGAVQAYDWSGFYVGAWLGAGWGASNWNFQDDDGAAVNPRFAGFLGGGDIGYNVQAGRWVYGLEGGAGPANARGARPCLGFLYNCEAGINWLSTVTGRVGYTFDRLLTYVKAGVVIAQGDAHIVCNTNSTSVVPTGCPSQSDSKILAGWTAGLGYEFGLTKNVSARGELMYFDLGSEAHNLLGVSSDIQRSGLISTLGLHYRFGG